MNKTYFKCENCHRNVPNINRTLHAVRCVPPRRVETSNREWQCVLCTYSNIPAHNVCMMCQSLRHTVSTQSTVRAPRSRCAAPGTGTSNNRTSSRGGGLNSTVASNNRTSSRNATVASNNRTSSRGGGLSGTVASNNTNSSRGGRLNATAASDNRTSSRGGRLNATAASDNRNSSPGGVLNATVASNISNSSRDGGAEAVWEAFLLSTDRVAFAASVSRALHNGRWNATVASNSRNSSRGGGWNALAEALSQVNLAMTTRHVALAGSVSGLMDTLQALISRLETVQEHPSQPPLAGGAEASVLAALPVRVYSSAKTGSTQNSAQQPQPRHGGKRAAPATRIGPSSAAAAVAQQEEETCAICMSEYQSGEMVKTLPCLHFYHTACVDEWLQQHQTCPICKHVTDTI